MEALIARGLQVVVLLQGAGWAEAPIRIFTFLGTADFFFLILPAVYWCVDAGLGARVAFILLLAMASTRSSSWLCAVHGCTGSAHR